MADNDYDWATEQVALRKTVQHHIERAIFRNEKRRWAGLHDEATFVMPWFEYHRLTGSKEILDFLLLILEYSREWQAQAFHHGYWKDGEAHHQSETFLNHLCHYWPITGAAEHIEIVEDAAHHVGNWVDGIPPWYDYEHNRFRSWFCGTKTVRDQVPDNFENMECWRYILIGLNAWQANGNDRYIELARTYGRSWQREILQTGHVVRLFRFPIDDLDEIERTYFVEGNWRLNRHRECHHYANRYGADWEKGLEAYKAVYGYAGIMTRALLDLWKLTGEDIWRQMVQRMVEIPAEKWGHKGPAGRLSAYEMTEVTGDESWAERAAAAVDRNIDPLPDCFISVPHPDGRKDGWQRSSINKFALSQPDGSAVPYPASNAGALLAAGTYLDDLDLHARAYRLAATQLEIALPVMRDGWEHGCGGSGFLAGPAGQATGALNAATMAPTHVAGKHQPGVLYSTEGAPGLPDCVAAVCRPRPTPRVTLANTGRSTRKIAVEPQTAQWKRPARIDGKACQMDTAGRLVVVLPPGQEKTVEFETA